MYCVTIMEPWFVGYASALRAGIYCCHIATCRFDSGMCVFALRQTLCLLCLILTKPAFNNNTLIYRSGSMCQCDNSEKPEQCP